MGFVYDNSELANEYTALTNVYNEYQAQLELGFVDPDVVSTKLLSSLCSQ
jgi:putative aldouronate transport system substrate-binding protein